MEARTSGVGSAWFAGRDIVVWLMDASDDHFGHRSISPRSAGNRRTFEDFVLC